MMTDPIADMFTRIRNAVRVERPSVEMPLSKVKRGLAEVLKREGYIWDWRRSRTASPCQQLAHRTEVRPERRARDSAHQAASASRAAACTAAPTELRPVLNGLGISIISTSRGVISDREARQRNLGGEVLCEVVVIDKAATAGRSIETRQNACLVLEKNRLPCPPASKSASPAERCDGRRTAGQARLRRFARRSPSKSTKPASRSSVTRDRTTRDRPRLARPDAGADRTTWSIGVAEGYEKKLEIVGVGYLAAIAEGRAAAARRLRQRSAQDDSRRA